MNGNICHRKTGFVISTRNSFSKRLSTLLSTYFLHSCVRSVTDCGVVGLTVQLAWRWLHRRVCQATLPTCLVVGGVIVLVTQFSSCVLRAYWTVHYVFIIVDISVNRILINIAVLVKKSNINGRGRCNVQQSIFWQTGTSGISLDEVCECY